MGSDMTSFFLLILGLLISVALGLAGWALKSVVSIQGEVKASNARSEERKENVNQRFIDVRIDMNEKIEAVRREGTTAYTDLQKTVAKLDDGVTRIHRRLDSVLLKQERDQA